MKSWNIFVHTISAFIGALIVNYLWESVALWRFVTDREAASIGIIGAADGPTSIFVSGTILSIILRGFLPGILVFIAFMVLYKPIKKRIERK